MLNMINKIPGRHSFAPRFFKKEGLLFLLLLTLLFLIIAFPFFPHLIIIDGKHKKLLFKSSLADSDEFVISFIHSTNLTPVDDYFKIEKDYTITLMESHFESYSVGMPSELNEGEVLELKNGKIIIKNMNRNLPYIDLRIGQLVANHTLIINNKTIPFKIIASPGSMVKIKAEKLSLLQMWGVFNRE